MLSLRPQNRRRRATQPPRWSQPVIPWAALGRWAVAAGSVAAVLLVIIWALNQPVSTVSVAGRFERVAPMDVEREVREHLEACKPCGHHFDFEQAFLTFLQARCRTRPTAASAAHGRSSVRAAAEDGCER